MPNICKPVDALTVADFQHHPVWEFALDDENAHDETWVRPVTKLPVETLDNHVVGAQVTLANGQHLWARIGGVDNKSQRRTEQFIGLAIEGDGKWQFLVPYHMFGRDQFGPEHLSWFLGLPLEDVFPITYDLSPYAVGDRNALCGQIAVEPREKLSFEERLNLKLSLK